MKTTERHVVDDPNCKCAGCSGARRGTELQKGAPLDEKQDNIERFLYLATRAHLEALRGE